MGRKPTEKANTDATRSCFSKKWKIQGEPSVQRIKQKSMKKYFLAWNSNEWLTPLIYALQDFRISVGFISPHLELELPYTCWGWGQVR